jgi:hypothetical protein
MSISNENREKYKEIPFPQRNCWKCHLKTPQLNPRCIHCNAPHQPTRPMLAKMAGASHVQ